MLVPWLWIRPFSWSYEQLWNDTLCIIVILNIWRAFIKESVICIASLALLFVLDWCAFLRAGNIGFKYKSYGQLQGHCWARVWKGDSGGYTLDREHPPMPPTTHSTMCYHNQSLHQLSQAWSISHDTWYNCPCQHPRIWSQRNNGSSPIIHKFNVISNKISPKRKHVEQAIMVKFSCAL